MGVRRRAAEGLGFLGVALPYAPWSSTSCEDLEIAAGVRAVLVTGQDLSPGYKLGGE